MCACVEVTPAILRKSLSTDLEIFDAGLELVHLALGDSHVDGVRGLVPEGPQLILQDLSLDLQLPDCHAVAGLSVLGHRKQMSVACLSCHTGPDPYIYVQEIGDANVVWSRRDTVAIVIVSSRTVSCALNCNVVVIVDGDSGW